MCSGFIKMDENILQPVKRIQEVQLLEETNEIRIFTSGHLCNKSGELFLTQFFFNSKLGSETAKKFFDCLAEGRYAWWNANLDDCVVTIESGIEGYIDEYEETITFLKNEFNKGIDTNN